MFEFIVSIWEAGGISALVVVAIVVLAIVLWRIISLISDLQKNRDENQKFIRDTAKGLEDKVEDLEDKLEKSEAARQVDREQYDKARARDETTIQRLIQERNEFSDKVKKVTEELEDLRKQFVNMDAERKIDKVQQEQIMKENELLNKQLDIKKRDVAKLERERTLLEKMLDEHKTRIDNLENDMRQLRHELSRAYDTIDRLTNSAMTQEEKDSTNNIIPVLDANGDEVITPILTPQGVQQLDSSTQSNTPDETSTDSGDSDTQQKAS